MVVAQLAERLLPMPKARGSNSVIGKFFIMNVFTVNCRKDEAKEKRPGKNHLKRYNENLHQNGLCAIALLIFLRAFKISSHLVINLFGHKLVKRN